MVNSHSTYAPSCLTSPTVTSRYPTVDRAPIIGTIEETSWQHAV